MTKEIKKNRACPAKRERCRGFVILFAVTLSAILLSIAIGVANIALKEIKFGTNARDTNNAFFAADTGAELALMNDKLGNYPPPELPETIAFSSFFRTGLGGNGTSCVKVDVTKNNVSPPFTVIVSKGYNIGDDFCESINPDRIEREIKVSY